MTKKDTDIIEWLNMLQSNQLNPATWVQAVLLAELAGQDIDAGGVYIAPPKKKASSLGLFGDDTVQKQETPTYGWNVRGFDGAYVPGSVFNLIISRPIILYVVNEKLRGRRMMSRYLKAVLRKHIRKLTTPPNEPPKYQNIEDIFILCEEHFPKFDARKYGRKKNEAQPSPASVHPKETDEALLSDDPTHGSSLTENMRTTKIGVEPNPPSPPQKKNPLLGYIS